VPRVSFIVPVRNAADTLADALQSLCAQTFTDCEILLFDDGSSDGSVAIAQAAALEDKRIKLVGNERVGLVEALVRLVGSSDSELIARMDADDLSHPKRLEKQVELLDARPDVQLAGSLIRCFPDSAVRGGMRRYEAWLNRICEPEEIAKDIFVESPLCHPSVLMRRAAYDEAGGYLDDGLPEDYGLWLRFFNLGFKMAKVKELLFSWRESETRLTRTDERYAKERFFDLKLRELLAGPLGDVKTIAVWGAGPTGKKWGRALKKSGLKITSFIDIHPQKVGRRARGVPIVSYETLEKGLPAEMLIAAVGLTGARRRIRKFMTDLGYRDLLDFICVA
jgi:glycosyltransferase involved in cell wall biosynthesis